MIGNVLGPLIVWQLKKDMDPFVDQQGKEALNFQLTFSLAMMICGVLAWILIGFPLMVLVSVVALVLVVIAGIRANEGKPYRYPFCWRIVRWDGFDSLTAERWPTHRVPAAVANRGITGSASSRNRRSVGRAAEARLARQAGAAHEAAQA